VTKEELFGELQKIVGSENVFAERTQLLRYRYGNVVDYRFEDPSFLPDFVIKPESAEQISSIVKLANKHKMAVVAWGGGTDFTGANSPIKGGIVIDMKNMDTVEVNQEEKSIVSGAGATLFKLSEAAEEAGMLFAHEITTQKSATIGGAIATNSFGYRSGKYRSIRNLISGIEAVLPTGEIIKTKPLFKTSTGYDLASLLVGSEGTLGITTEVTMRLYSKPEAREISTYIFNSFEDGFMAGEEIRDGMSPDFFSLGELSFLRYSENPETFFINSAESGLLSKYLRMRYPAPSSSARILERIFLLIPGVRQLISIVDDSISKKGCMAVLTVGFEGEEKSVKAATKQAKSKAQSYGGAQFEDDSFYRDRFKSFVKLKGIIEDHFPDQKQDFSLATFDLSIPKSQVIKMKDTIKDLLKNYGSIHMLYSELYSSISTLGIDLIVEAGNKGEYQNFLDELAEKTFEAGGSISFAHGVGTRFLPYLEKDVGENYIQFMKKIKSALDPNNVLNPGKMGDFP